MKINNLFLFVHTLKSNLVSTKIHIPKNRPIYIVSEDFKDGNVYVDAIYMSYIQTDSENDQHFFRVKRFHCMVVL